MRDYAGRFRGTLMLLFMVDVMLGLPGSGAESRHGANTSKGHVSIDVDATQVIGTVSPYIFGENLEHEHGAINGNEQNQNYAHGLHSGGIWAEMLRDRKFEEGDRDQDGVADGWVAEERITNRYVDLVHGQGPLVHYRIDRDEYYGGGASQAIDLYGEGSNHASIYQILLHFTKGRRYAFYVYLKRRGSGSAWVEFEKLGGPVYGRKDFPNLSDQWEKYSTEFVASEDTDEGRVRIAVQGLGTFWIDSASLMPADNLRGMRHDVVEALKPLGVPLLRYPGGCFADLYSWREDVGPRDKRPEFFSSVWNEWEPEDFGIDEFMDFAKELGSEAQITTNYLTGTPEEAGQWVEYTNGSTDTPMGHLRSQNGHPEAYGIKLWAVGNEVQELCSGEYIGANHVADYARRYQEYKGAILKADPTVRVMAVGAPPGPLEWNRDLFSLVPFDLLGVSIYTGEGRRMDDFDTKIMDFTHFYRHTVAEPRDFEQDLDKIIAALGDHFPADHPLIAVTEFNSWCLTEKVDPDFRLCDALYLAGVYHVLMRRAKQVSIAEIEAIVNMQGTIEINQTAVKLTPEYFAYLLYRHHTGKSILATSTGSPMLNFNAQVAAFDSIATLSDDGHTLYLAVINRNESEDSQANIRIRGWTLQAGTPARAFELNSKDRDASNPFGSSANVNIRDKSLDISRIPFSYRFPAHSVTVIELTGGR
jgi:alpha-L-arabinofuranosidase